MHIIVCSDLVWEEPITEAEMERGRGIAGEHASNETMALVRAGLESERSRDERAIMRELSARWPNNIVPYRIETTFTPEHRAVIASVSNSPYKGSPKSSSSSVFLLF